MEPLIRALKTLTIAVWCLCGLVAAQLGFYGMSYMSAHRALSPARPEGAGLRPTTIAGAWTPLPIDERHIPFHELPPEQLVARSSAIVLVSYQKDNDRFKAVVAEVLKLDPNVQLYYGVGDEMRMLSYYPKDGEGRGEGQVVFMAGSPAQMRSSYSFDGGRIGGLGDMPLDTLRKMVIASKR